MNQAELIAILKDNCLMQTEEETDRFENALNELLENGDEQFLSQYHLILDDNCQQSEVMFGLVHFLESFDVEKQISAFINVVPQLMINAPEWARIIHDRILNDELACQVYDKLLHSVNTETPHFIYSLLEASIINHQNEQDNS
ncbi:Imm30 family immunity protein [Anabaena sp. FACHB-709]|uniref:Immunity protein 30 domain-containing protein n=2 Tax=Nostocaceae TaxID=1162 RepID=A0A1Z4KQ24_ANAVA|nr:MULTISPECIES: Imm30 family immunity protein [Nostocaceae]BAY70983.1 hypothetical protein NIES23_37960 [Trichormus variabilis NIES-23]HBW30816.1 hypothetical protein [Nostoc sp. UBA8866]MBD2171380.1 hypothetical protein [Anabaena cylindrica FACHB-318]MBD2262950.1 hypothetical protein [Anabaena sp. FACHB-709]MBD2272708.1 hypothetical protein [Nostoc sp. PCC 7120 = FACHB-418]